MKKNLSVTILFWVLLSLPVISQDASSFTKPTLKGNLIIGGDFKFAFSHDFEKAYYNTIYISESEFKVDEISLSVSPEIGYFIIDGLAIGVSPIFSYSYTKSTILFSSFMVDTKGHSLGIGGNLFLKYYLKNCIFFEIASGYSYSKSTNYSTHPSSNNIYSIIPSIGYAIFLNSKVSIEPKINYEFNNLSMKYSDQSTAKESANGISLSAQFSIFF
jgi:hypothetical protein